ncbi:MAG: helix-turn-helix transcriptional regulator [Rhodobacteraceae bacterium]|nr:helix-turn-helix transcriptional regulator [Paracoccaceae bacterium]MCY4137066.1 helix-turn-helix transcriptional regulator [Paracoccaceae bacterium]
MTKLSELKAEFLSDPDNREAYEALSPEFDLARKLIAARVAAGLSQAEVAERMGTRQSEVSRIEGGRQNVSIAKLANYAEAVGAKLDIRLDPVRPDG